MCIHYKCSIVAKFRRLATQCFGNWQGVICNWHTQVVLSHLGTMEDTGEFSLIKAMQTNHFLDYIYSITFKTRYELDGRENSSIIAICFFVQVKVRFVCPNNLLQWIGLLDIAKTGDKTCAWKGGNFEEFSAAFTLLYHCFATSSSTKMMG